MIGHDHGDDGARDGLLRTREPPRKLLLAGLIFLVAGATVVLPITALSSGSTTLSATPDYWIGATLGGWLVMEINPTKADGIHPDMRPSWMFDQIAARSELDFVSDLRSAHGDEYAIATMTNHWSQYYTSESLDAAQALGVNSVRIPIGYWIMDAPVGGTSPEEYGISPEGFVTDGGVKLYDDMIFNTIGDIPKCPIGAGPWPPGPQGFYPTTRTPTDGMQTWGDVGVHAVGALAAWVASLPRESQGAVAALQLANEPALGPAGIFDAEINSFYMRALRAAREHLPTTSLLMSFMHPLPTVIDFLTAAATVGVGLAGGAPAGGAILADHHYYLNWQAPPGEPLAWAEIHRRACLLEAEMGAREVDAYAAQGQKIIVGEWSIATNLDAPRDLDDQETVANLRQLYKEQLEQFTSKANVVGFYYWTLRMGSGWDPRPTGDHPNGRQIDGTSASRSLPGYPFKVWSLLEMASLGIATRLDLSYEGTC